ISRRRNPVTTEHLPKTRPPAWTTVRGTHPPLIRQMSEKGLRPRAGSSLRHGVIVGWRPPRYGLSRSAMRQVSRAEGPWSARQTTQAAPTIFSAARARPPSPRARRSFAARFDGLVVSDAVAANLGADAPLEAFAPGYVSFPYRGERYE